jgi:hypothetical protein
MKNEFEKLDGFMREHKPALGTLRPVKAPATRSWWLPLSAGAALAIALVVAVNIQNRNAALEQEAVASMEALDWDMSDEELPTDVTDLVALVD